MDSSRDMERDARDFRQVYERRSRTNRTGFGNVVRHFDLNIPLCAESAIPIESGSGKDARDFDLNIPLCYESFIAKTNDTSEIGDDGVSICSI
jgi:hypothetical protein